MLPVSVRDVIALVAQCQFVLPSLFAFESVTRERGHAQLGTPGFGDQTITVRWVQDNAAVFEVQPALVIVFGRGAGA